MKKFFSLVLTLVAVLTVNAKQVVFDYSNPQALGITPPEAGKATNLEDGQTIVVDGVTMSHVKNASTATRIWNSSGVYDLRIYTGSTITFTAEEDITAIEFDGGAVAFSEIAGKSWVGTAKSVTFTASATCKISTATIYIGEPSDVWVPDTINVAKAFELIKAGDKNDHFVAGIVATQPFNTFSSFSGRVSSYLVDDLASTDSLQAYQIYDKNNQKWASLEDAQYELRIGDTVLVYAGSLKLYAEKSIYEIDPGYYVEKLGANPDAPEPIIITPDTITVAQALEIGKALADNATTEVEYVVAGYAVKAYAPKEGYSDQTWYMADESGAYGEFQAYQCTPDRLVEDNDYMLVRGKILKYVGSSTTIEIKQGTAVHGVAPEIEVLEVSVAEALEIGNALADGAATAEMYAVSGYVVRARDYEDGKQTFYMADEKDAAYGAFTAFKAKIEAPGVVAGDFVEVIGHIKKYVAEGADPTIEIENGTAKVIGEQGIENITLTEDAQKVLMDGVLYIIRDNKAYNVQGIRVR